MVVKYKQKVYMFYFKIYLLFILFAGTYLEWLNIPPWDDSTLQILKNV